MRPVLVGLMVLSYLVLGVYDVSAGSPRTAAASGLLAVVNLLLLGV